MEVSDVYNALTVLITQHHKSAFVTTLRNGTQHADGTDLFLRHFQARGV
jgi:hypothetical protein